MNIKAISELLKVGEIAVAMLRAETDARSLKEKYNFSIRDYESAHGQLGCRLNPTMPAHAAAVAHTKPAFNAYREAVRRKQNLKKRLMNAARKVPQEAP